MADKKTDKSAEDFKNLHEKLLFVKKQVAYLKKDTKGHNYQYASPELVLGELNPLLNEVGVMLKSEVVNVEHEVIEYSTDSGKGKIEVLYNVKMLCTWIDTENPDDREPCEWHGSGMNDFEKGYGSALTYGERYFMLKYFNIPTGKDDPDSFQKERGASGKSGDSFKDNVSAVNHESIIERMNECENLDELKGLWVGLNTYAQHNEHVLKAKKDLKDKFSKKTKAPKKQEAKEETADSVAEEFASDDKEGDK